MIVIFIIKKLIVLLGRLKSKLNIKWLFFIFWKIKLNVVDFKSINIIIVVVWRVIL